MTADLLPYYERELTFIRQMAVEFSQKYPEIAERLQLEPHRCEDPHVERLIESFALLAGRIHRKIDDEFPEITESMMEVLYPHYLRPIPSLGIVQFQLDPGQSDAASLTVPAGSLLTAPSPDGETCSFKTAYDVTVSPLRVAEVSIAPLSRFSTSRTGAHTTAAIRIRIDTLEGARFAAVTPSSLRFHIHSDAASALALYELICLNAVRVSIRSLQPGAAGATEIPLAALQPVGLREDDGVLPYSDRSFLGYRLLQEYFAFPEKFLFFELSGLDRLPLRDSGSSVEITIELKDSGDPLRLSALEQSMDADTFRLGCTPIANLFELIAEPIRISQSKSEYRVVPDQHRPSSTEVFSIDSVASLSSYGQEPIVYQPFYSIGHSGDTRRKRFWAAHRRPSPRPNDEGTDVYISLLDLDGKPALPSVEMLSVRATCTNRDYVSKLRLSGVFGELQAEGLPSVACRCLRRPTPSLRPRKRAGLDWRLISSLSLNHLSIAAGGREALQEILRIYDFTGTAARNKQIDGVARVSSRPSVARIMSQAGAVFCRGIDIDVDFNEQEYAGASPYLFASVLERFFALYASINSFTRLTASTSKGELKRWPPAAGAQILA